jgi:hypothetical protein
LDDVEAPDEIFWDLPRLGNRAPIGPLYTANKTGHIRYSLETWEVCKW